MQNFDFMSREVKPRVDRAIKESLEIYLNKLNYGLYQLGVEAPLQLHVMKLLEQKLDQYTLSTEERFVIDLEKDIPLCGRRDEVDGVIEYYLRGELKEQYLIEFKYKKRVHGGPNSGNLDAYVDIYELERQKATNRLVKGCYFIFVTNDQRFTIPGDDPSANRMVFPLYDGYKIERRRYIPQVPAAVRQLRKSRYEELVFGEEHDIEYRVARTNSGNNYWFFLLEI